MRAYDFFCGAGGLTRGLLDAGIEVVSGFDNDEGCRETYERNNPGIRLICKDIRQLEPSDLCVGNPSRRDTHLLFVGCAPCQPFSKQRKGISPRKDSTLLNEFGRLVESCLPDFVLIENVPGMANVPGFSTFRRFLRMLHENEYCFDYRLLNAKDFGVPQNRLRLVLVASRSTTPSLPAPSHGRTLMPFSTVRDAIAQFPRLSAGERHPSIPNHEAAALTDVNLERIRHTPHNGGDRRSWPDHLWLACHKKNYQGHTDVYGRMCWDSPAPTLTGRCNTISTGRYGHPEQNRAISLREAATLQSFPENYQFYGGSTHIAKQIGNAVPVRFAEALGKHIAKWAA